MWGKGIIGNLNQMIKIGDKVLGEKPYIIAEFGVNHNGSFERAKEAIVAAAQAGADAIKFQTYTADELVVKGTPKFWKSEGGDIGNDQYEAYKALGGTPYEWYPELMKICEDNGIEFLSTPFSIKAADYLNSIGMKAFKVASSDLSTLPYLEHIAKFGKPILLSTGASTMEEIHEAVETIENAGNTQIVVLHCTLCYPTKPEDANFNMIRTLSKEFPFYAVGISDHTLGVESSIVAAAYGAQVIEKHFTVDKTLPDSADHWLSVDPSELKEIVDRSSVYGGYSEKFVLDCENETRIYDKRSLVSACDIIKGTVITKDMITYKRPGTGIWPKFLPIVVGKKALIDIKEDTTLTWDLIG
jgi:sialic acid synthase SpsE